MHTRTIKKAIKVGAQVAQVGINAERLKGTVTNAVEDTVNSARRAAKHGRYAMEDFVDEATYSIKRRPLQAVGLTLGIGFAMGTIIGFALARVKCTGCCYNEREI